MKNEIKQNLDTTFGGSEEYTRNALAHVRKDPILSKIIEKFKDIKINYIDIYYKTNHFGYDEILQLRDFLKDEMINKDISKKQRGIITKMYDLLDMSYLKLDVRFAILIEELSKYADKWKFGIGVEPGSKQPYVYNGFYWTVANESLMKEFLAEIATLTGLGYYEVRVNSALTKLYEQFCTLCPLFPDLNENKGEVKINLQNGTYVFSDGKGVLRDFDKRDFFKYQLPFKYDENATCDEFHKFLDRVQPEKESQMILAEYLGYIFTTGLKLEKCLILKGEGSNGKSVIFEIVQALLGEQNICTYTISNLCNENGYFRAQLANVLLNYSSELGGKNINPDLFKKLISNEPVDARSPYGHPFILRNYGKFMFNTNKFPNNIEFTHAYLRRFIILSFDVTIPEEEQDKNLAKRIISTELSGIFNWVLEGLQRLLKQQRFTESPKAKEVLEEMRYESDTVKQFVEEKGYKPSLAKEDGLLYKTFKQEYRAYCAVEGVMPVGEKELGVRLQNLGFHRERSKGGGQIHIFLKKDPVYKTVEDTFNINSDETID